MRNELGRASSGRWETGTRLGDYVLLRELGRGGMGQVFLARHVETGREVALKTHGGNDPELTLRFQREGEALARVDAHPAVVRVHSAGTHQGRAYLIMDYLPGGSLLHRLEERGPLAPHEAAQLVGSLARGVAHVHRHGILHRDLKPANVLLGPDDEPRLADFGLARVQGADGLTVSGTMLGTIGYMAPEQARGGGDVDARTDVYGLGGILFHALTGRPPFVGKPHEAIRAVVETNPLPPSKLREGVPPGLDAICLRALARRPEARYPSAEALAEALEAYLAADPEDEVGLPLEVRLLLGLAGLALVLSLALVAVLIVRREAKDPPVSPSLAQASPSPAATPLATPEPSPSAPRVSVEPARFPPDDCLRLARSLRGESPQPEAQTLLDCEAYLRRAVESDVPGAALELGVILLESGQDAEGLRLVEAGLARALDDGVELGRRLTGWFCLVVVHWEQRRGTPRDIREGIGRLCSAVADFASSRFSSDRVFAETWRVQAVARQPSTAALLLDLLRDPDDLAYEAEVIDELADWCEDAHDDGRDMTPGLALLDALAEDGYPDPVTWNALGELYERLRDHARERELHERVIDTDSMPHLRAHSRRELASLLAAGKGGPQDLERARELLDADTLKRQRTARELLEEIEEKLARGR